MPDFRKVRPRNSEIRSESRIGSLILEASGEKKIMPRNWRNFSQDGTQGLMKGDYKLIPETGPRLATPAGVEGRRAAPSRDEQIVDG